MSSSQDDAFREIQLSGKQLVFIFMAVVVIGVSVFLMGVMVGRGVLAAKGAPGAESAVAANEADIPPPPASASAGSTSSPSTVGEKLSYAERLNAPEAQKETLKPDAEPPAEAPSPKAEAPASEPEPTPAAAKAADSTTAAKAAAAPKPEPTKPEPAKPEPAKKTETLKPEPAKAAVPATPSAVEPAGAGFAIQVAALKEASEADAIVKKLAGKGYPAYVVTPQKGAPSMYRVRVGKYKERREADTVAARLQKEEQFKPWIVR